jgi:hypothetical protein
MLKFLKNICDEKLGIFVGSFLKLCFSKLGRSKLCRGKFSRSKLDRSKFSR